MIKCIVIINISITFLYSIQSQIDMITKVHLGATTQAVNEKEDIKASLYVSHGMRFPTI